MLPHRVFDQLLSILEDGHDRGRPQQEEHPQ